MESVGFDLPAKVGLLGYREVVLARHNERLARTWPFKFVSRVVAPDEAAVNPTLQLEEF